MSTRYVMEDQLTHSGRTLKIHLSPRLWEITGWTVNIKLSFLYPLVILGSHFCRWLIYFNVQTSTGHLQKFQSINQTILSFSDIWYWFIDHAVHRKQRDWQTSNSLTLPLLSSKIFTLLLPYRCLIFALDCPCFRNHLMILF